MDHPEDNSLFGLGLPGSNGKHITKNPGCLGYIGGLYYLVIWGLIINI